MNKLKKFFKTILLGFALGTSAFAISSCSNVEKKADAYDFELVSCNYNSDNDTTKVNFKYVLVNTSIYDVKEEYFKFDLYDGDTFISTTNYIKFSISLGNGCYSTMNCNFIANGKVTNVTVNGWYPTFSSLWDSYSIWFIAVIVAAPLLSIIYIIVMIVKELDFDDLIDFLEEHLWIVTAFGVPFIPYLINSIISGVWSWVIPLIILGGLVFIVLSILLAHLIRFLIQQKEEKMGDYNPRIEKLYDSKNIPFLKEEGNSKRYYIQDLSDDIDTLTLFSKKDLREYCIKKGWFEANNMFSKKKMAILIADMSRKGKKSKNTKATNKNKVSKISFDDIAGLEVAKKAFKEKVVMPFLHPEIFQKFGKKAGGGILLYGLPGTGKTMFAEAAANEIDALFISIKCSDIKSKWYGESEKKVKEIFAKARKAEKAIIFFDEFEAIGSKRTDSDNNGNNDLVPQILAEMQGVGTSSNKSVIIVIAATNKPWAIDSAFMRPGRFDEKIYIPLPDFEARKKLFELQLSKLPISDDLDFDYLSKISDGFNGADVKEMCEKLKMSAINKSLDSGAEQKIGMDDVRLIEKSIKSSVSNEDIERLEEFENQ